MNEKVLTFIHQFNEAVADTQKFLFITRAKELQEDACRRLASLKERAANLKKETITDQDDDSANVLLCPESVLEATMNELRMWIALKDDDPNAAWDCLINCQGACRDAILAHTAVDLENYISRLHTLEKLIFPQLFFSSTRMVIARSECSICGEEYGECDHLEGRPYMGQICARIVREIREVIGADMVDDPADKHCRILQFTEAGITRDYLTLRVISLEPTS